MEMEMLLCCVFNPVSVRCFLLARKVGLACGTKIIGAARSGGAPSPVIHRLLPWMPLITAPKAVVGRFRPTRRLVGAAGPLGAAGAPLCRVMHHLRLGTHRIASE
jgi:hypothetical protein